MLWVTSRSGMSLINGVLFSLSKTPVTHSRMYRQIAEGFLIRKMLKNVE